MKLSDLSAPPVFRNFYRAWLLPPNRLICSLPTKAVARIIVRGDSPSPSHTFPPPLPSLPFPPPPLPSPLPGGLPHYQLEGLRERCKLPHRGPGQSPGRKRKRILGHFCGSETYLMAAISPRCYAVQMTKFTQYLLKKINILRAGGLIP